MATLSTPHKVFIVTALARFHTPTEVAEAVQQEFGLEVTRQQVDYYNPKTSTGRDRLAKRWKELHEEARRRYLGQVEEVAVAHERWRLEKLEKIVRDRMDRMDHGTAMKALEQAARERGKAYTNVTDLQSKGKPVETPNIFVYGGEPPEEEQDGED